MKGRDGKGLEVTATKIEVDGRLMNIDHSLWWSKSSMSISEFLVMVNAVAFSSLLIWDSLNLRDMALETLTPFPDIVLVFHAW